MFHVWLRYFTFLFRDRVRTVTNAMSKAIGAPLINELCQKDLLTQVNNQPSEKNLNHASLEMDNTEHAEYQSLHSDDQEMPERNHNV